MKSSWSLNVEPEPDFEQILQFDRTEIDNPDLHAPARLHYMDRLRTVVSLVEKHFPNAAETRVGDFGCGQGNASLILAERGYQVFAFDHNRAYLEYSRRKWELGKIEWIAGRVDELDFPHESLDAALLGEILVCCAYPENILRGVMRFVRPGGLLIATVPNGERIGMPWPAFRSLVNGAGRKALEASQFGGETLFRLRPEDFRKPPMPQEAALVETHFCGGSLWINRYTRGVFRILPAAAVERLNRWSCQAPLLKRWTAHHLCVVLEKR